MTITALGELEVGVAVPGCAVAVSAGVAGINGALPQLELQISALATQIGLLPSLPPVDPSAMLSNALQLVASLQSMIALGIPVPSLGAQLGALQGTLVALQVVFDAIGVNLSALVALQAPLAVAGIGAYVYDGPVDNLGAELGAAVGGGSDHCNALALVAFAPGAWAALSQIMKVT